MLSFARNACDAITGRGTAAVTIPAMDGPLRANGRLQDSRRMLSVECPDNLVRAQDTVYFSTGTELHALMPGERDSTVCAVFDGRITALASDADGALAIGVEGHGIELRDRSGQRSPLKSMDGARFGCTTALAFRGPGTLYACEGSTRLPASQWQRSLMERDASGSVWKLELQNGRASRIATNLAYPNGILVDSSGGGVVVSEAWRHRLVRIVAPSKGMHQTVLSNLPGYPARLSAAAQSGYWLAVFAPRSQLIEFVLKERAYCARMMREVADPNLWVAPALGSGKTFLEPLQGGAVKQMGIRKPWAPTRSYGLVLRLDEDFHVLESLHSRADGNCHGITSCVQHGDALLSTSGGGNALLETLL